MHRPGPDSAMTSRLQFQCRLHPSGFRSPRGSHLRESSLLESETADSYKGTLRVSWLATLLLLVQCQRVGHDLWGLVGSRSRTRLWRVLHPLFVCGKVAVSGKDRL